MSANPSGWLRPDWFPAAEEWIAARLHDHGLRATAPVELVRERPWSTVLSLQTHDGLLYFKAVPNVLKYEAALTAFLAQAHPESIPALLGVQRERGWILMRDGGPPIRERMKETGSFAPWLPVLPQYASLQIELAARVPELLALGVPDRRPETLGAQYERLLEDRVVLRVDREPGVTRDEYARLQARVPQVYAWGAELAAMPIPASLNHGDLNSSNVFGLEPPFAFGDWGDAGVAHPFFSLRTVMVSVEIVLDLPEGDPSLAPLRDTYLESWARFGPPDVLRRAFGDAMRLSSISGALAWYTTVSILPPAEQETYAVPVPSLLQEFLNVDMTQFPYN